MTEGEPDPTHQGARGHRARVAWPGLRREEPEMPVIGERRAPEEDTTPEVLEREREELARQRHALRKEAVRQEREAVAAGRARTPAPAELRHRRRVTRSVRVACGLAALLIGAGALLVPDTVQPGEAERFAAVDTARAEWADVALAMDEEAAMAAGGQDLGTRLGTGVSSQYLADDLVEDVSGDLSDAMGISLAEARLADHQAALEQRPLDPEQVVTAWDEGRRYVGGAVSPVEVAEAEEPLGQAHPVAWLLLVSGALVLGVLALVLAVTGPRLVSGLAALALVPTGMLMLGAATPPDGVEQALDAHRAAVARADHVYRALGTDQAMLTGVQEPAGSDAWETPRLHGDQRATGVHEQELVDAWDQARARAAGLDLDGATPAEVYAVLEPITAAGQALHAERQQAVTATREAVLEAAEGRGDYDTALLAGSAALALVLAAGAAAGAAPRTRKDGGAA